MQILIQKIVSDISIQVDGLNELRRRKFLDWLIAHSSIVQEAVQDSIEVESVDIHAHLKKGLQSWFESLSLSSLFWEYCLILDEIKWWRDLEQSALTRTMQSERLDEDA